MSTTVEKTPSGTQGLRSEFMIYSYGLAAKHQEHLS